MLFISSFLRVYKTLSNVSSVPLIVPESKSSSDSSTFLIKLRSSLVASRVVRSLILYVNELVSNPFTFSVTSEVNSWFPISKVNSSETSASVSPMQLTTTIWLSESLSTLILMIPDSR